MWGEVVKDVQDGIVPTDVADYSALHSHVDANDYPLAVCAMEWLEADDFAFANRLEEVVDARIRAGDLRTVAVLS
jgi:hypothetical protein